MLRGNASPYLLKMVEPDPEGSEELLASLRGLAFALLGDQSMADDVLQDFWIAAREQSLSDVRNLPAWSRSVVRNLARAEKKSRANRAYREMAVANAERVEDNPGAAMERAALREHLVQAVRNLDARFSRVLWAHFFEGQSQKQIAAELGRPLSTIKSDMRRGLAQLRSRLEPKFGTDRAFGLTLLGAVDWDKQTASGFAAPATVFGFTWYALALSSLALCTLLPLAFFLSQDNGTNTDLAGKDLEKDRAATVAQAEAAREHEAIPPSTSANPIQERARAEVGQVVEQRTRPADPVTLPDQAEIYSLRVVDEDGSPVSGAELWRGWDTTFQKLGSTDNTGVLNLGFSPTDVVEHSLVTGRERTQILEGISLQARSAHHADSWRYFIHPEVRAEREIDLMLRGPGLQISGEVYDSSGRPIPDALVTVVFDRANTGRSYGVVATHMDVPSVRTDARGHFSFRGLTQKLHSIAASTPGFPSASVAVDGRGRALAHCQIELRPGATLRGRVQTADGAPAEGIDVQVVTQRRLHEDRWDTTTDANGRFVVEDVPGGTLRMEASGAQGRARRELDWDPSDTAPIELELAAVTTLTVQAVDLEGQGLPEIEIFVQQVGTRWQRRISTSEDGLAVLEHCPLGELRLIAKRLGEGHNFPVTMARIDSVPTGPVVLECDVRESSICGVRGRLRPTVEGMLSGSALHIRHLASTFSGRLWMAAGQVEFSLGRMTPGAYELMYASPSHGQALLLPFEVTEGVKDLGTLRLPDLASLHIEWTWPAVDQKNKYRFRQIVQSSNRQGAVTLVEGTGQPVLDWQLVPGAWVLLVYDPDGKVIQQRLIVLRSNKEHLLYSGPGVPGIANLDFHGQSNQTGTMEIRIHDVAPEAIPSDTSDLDQETQRKLTESQPEIYRGTAERDSNGIFGFGVPIETEGFRIVAGRLNGAEWRYYNFTTKTIRQMWHAWDL